MKILQVRFKNLNSLVGEWEIDLTHPAFASDGIFAITGPTGAGKTTILDAICLALYGQTPRLNRIGKSGNEVMSRQTSECFAEVTFETEKGCYRCHWSQHRARKKPNGDLQAPKHEIANAVSGEILESKIKGVAGEIEAATGMDFSRFTRSMLLAQGGFAAFLQAGPDERSPILEQITGTGIYSQISVRVHERQGKEREKLNLLQAETAGIVSLEPEQEKAIGQELETKLNEEAVLNLESARTAEAIHWLTTIDRLNKEIVDLAGEASDLQSGIEAFKPDRETLDRGLRAASLDGAHATLMAARKQQADDKAALKAEEDLLPCLERSGKEQAETLKRAECQTTQLKENLKAIAPIWREVRLLDQKLVELKKSIVEAREGRDKDDARRLVDEQSRQKEHKKRLSAHEALARIDGYLRDNARDEWLTGGLTGVEEKLRGLILTQKEILDKEAEQEKAKKILQQALKSLADCQSQTRICERELGDEANRLRQGKEALNLMLEGRLLREYRTEKDTLLREMSFLAKIAELKEQRKQLEDGRPCPLCGATAHPFAVGNVPLPDITEQKINRLASLISKAEEQENIIKQLENGQNLAHAKLAEAEKRELLAANDCRNAEKTLLDVKDGLEKLYASFARQKLAVTENLKPLGIADLPQDRIASLLEDLRARLMAWQNRVKERQEIERQIADIDKEVNRLDAVIETQTIALSEKLERLGNLENELSSLADKRNALFGDKNPDDEEQRLNNAISEAESAEKQEREKYHELRQKWNVARNQADSLKKRLEQREPELVCLEDAFFASLADLGFTDEERFLAARLSPDEKNTLLARQGKLDERQMDLKARQKDRQDRLAAEMARNVTEKGLEELESQSRDDENSLKNLREMIAGFRNRLSENLAAKEKIKGKLAAIEAQKKECRRWENLHELIGSADGRKYRNFAQGLTFERMIDYANRQLRKMTDRYLLIRDDAQPLELKVIDSYQASETRSTKNLSGGEGFIVSLSLALGLSQMASKNVRVDSLFLDEGFGTLDEEALDTALETLAGLKRDGKLIGVISHVPALKERIATQIQVEPRTGGKSQISGPGCRRVRE